MATDKSFYNKKIKVSQSTIDDIKRMGMTKALKLAGQNSKASQGGLVKEYQEATKRLYGQRRFSAATGSSTVKPKPMDSRFTGLGAGKPKPMDSRFTGLGAGKPKPMDSRFTGLGTGKPKPSTSMKPKSSSSNNTKSNILKGLGAVAVGGLILAATKNPAAAARAGSLAMKGKNTVQATKKAGPIAGKISRKGPGTQMEFAKKAAEDKMRSNLTQRAAAAAKKAPVKSVPKKKTPSITKKKFGIAGGVAGTSASNKQIKRK